jgi:hypothetical protein
MKEKKKENKILKNINKKKLKMIPDEIFRWHIKCLDIQIVKQLAIFVARPIVGVATQSFFDNSNSVITMLAGSDSHSEANQLINFGSITRQFVRECPNH